MLSSMIYAMIIDHSIDHSSDIVATKVDIQQLSFDSLTRQ